MLALSLLTVLEEASASSKRLTGNVGRLEDLLDRNNVAALATLPGISEICGFLAFHPRADAAIAEYIRSGTLADDSGPRLLVLFTLDTPAPIPVAINEESFAGWIDIEAGSHPAYRMVRLLFGETPVPPLPGIVFFRLQDLADHPKVVYVPLLESTDETTVRAMLRRIFSLADHAAAGKRPLDDLCLALHDSGLDYERTGRIPLREWLLRGYKVVDDNKGDIVGAVGLFG